MRSKIEWLKSVDGKLGYTINPVKGLCPMNCMDKSGKPYCYARRMYKRFKWDEKINWYPPAWDLVDTLKKPSRIFVGSTFELFYDALPYNWMEYNLLSAKKYPQHTFIFLTKQPYNLIKWDFPDNCWVGISTTGNDSRSGLEDNLKEVKAKVKFVSIEPLLDYTPMDFRWVDWVIVGRCTPLSEKTKPRINWIADIIERADAEKVPVFLKNNLRSLLPEEIPLFNKNQYELRQEFPKL